MVPERAPAMRNPSARAHCAKLSGIGDAHCARGVAARAAAGGRYRAS